MPKSAYSDSYEDEDGEYAVEWDAVSDGTIDKDVSISCPSPLPKEDDVRVQDDTTIDREKSSGEVDTNENYTEINASQGSERTNYPSDLIETHAVRHDAKFKHTMDLSTSDEASHRAAMRIRQYRQHEAKRLEQQKEKETQDNLRRREFRSSNAKIYQALGVAGTTAQERLRAYARQEKMMRKQEQVARDREQVRWYSVPDRYRREPLLQQHVHHLMEVDHKERVRSKKAKCLKVKTVKKNLNQVQNESKDIIASCVGRYERGSYFLKI